MHVDLPALGTKFEIPIFIVQGAEDLHALPDMARAYFDSIRAPQKEFYLVAGTGHEPSAALLDRIHAVLLKKIRPLAMSAARRTVAGAASGSPINQQGLVESAVSTNGSAAKAQKRPIRRSSSRTAVRPTPRPSLLLSASPLV
jgi:fermentation-respiration switch protein FrsA (DUF1100 family)